MKEFIAVLYLFVFISAFLCDDGGGGDGGDFSPRIRSVAALATAEIRRLKQFNGEHDKCTDLRADIISARTQAVPGHSGVKYSLQLRVSPTRVESKRCDHIVSAKSTHIWQPELCDVEMLEQPWLKTSDDVTVVRSACLKIED